MPCQKLEFPSINQLSKGIGGELGCQINTQLLGVGPGEGFNVSTFTGYQTGEGPNFSFKAWDDFGVGD